MKKDLSKVILETKRLRLVPVSDEHIEEIFSGFQEPTIKYMNSPAPKSLDEIKERHENWKVQLKEGTRLFMAVHLKETNEFLGCFALEDLDQDNPEMGGWLKNTAHGQRYGQEACAALKKWADENLEYDHILWPCAKENIASRKVAESLGGKIQREYVYTTNSGKTWDYLDYWIPRV